MSSALLPLGPAVADDRRSHLPAGAYSTRPVVDYLQHGSYVSYSQASSRAYFGTMPVYDISTTVPAYQDESLYSHPDAVPNGLVAAADEYAIYETAPWCSTGGYSRGAPPTSVPLTAEAIAYQAAQVAHTCDTSSTAISSPAASLHIDTNVTHRPSYQSPQVLSTVSPSFSPASVQENHVHYSTISPAQESYYTLATTDLTTASTGSTVDPGDQPFIFSSSSQSFLVSSPVSPTAASPYGTSWDTGGDESMAYAGGYESFATPAAHATQSSAQAPAPTTLAVPTPRAAAAEDVPERLERYVSGSPDATPAPQHVSASAADGPHVAPAQPHSRHSSVGYPSPPRTILAARQQDGHEPCWVPYTQVHDDHASHVGGYASASAPPSAFYAGGQGSATCSPAGTSPAPSAFTGTLHYHASPAYTGAASVLDAAARAKKGRRRKRTPEPRKPLVMACLFCRGRKIACGPPPPGSDDRSCDQCKRRDQPCEYPLECRRGQRKPRSDRSITADDDERGRSVVPSEGERRLAPALPSSMPWSSS